MYQTAHLLFLNQLLQLNYADVQSNCEQQRLMSESVCGVFRRQTLYECLQHMHITKTERA